MSAILKTRVPFFRRKTNGGTDGMATFYLLEEPKYLPTLNQVVTISHTNVPTSSGLKTKLTNISTNTVVANFQSFEQNSSQESVVQTDGYANFLVLQYQDLSFSTSQFAGDCTGYIEYDVNPAIYSTLKPIESAVVVNESIPFDLNDGFIQLTHKVTGSTYPTHFVKGMFVKRTDTNTIFANLMKSLNLPVAAEEMKKYTRSALGTMTVTTSNTYTTIIDGTKYIWAPWVSSAPTSTPLFVHPVTGWTGEYYGTAMQTIGTYEFAPTNKSILPVPNDLYLILEIPNSAYGEIIDGKTVRMTLPFQAGASTANTNSANLGVFSSYNATVQQLEAYGTYNVSNISVGLDKVLSEKDLSAQSIGSRPDLSRTDYESNIVLLFSNTILTPQGSNFTSWATGHSDLIDGTRVFTVNNQQKALFNHINDRCIGFAALDKGFIVITHPLVVDSYFKNVFNGIITAAGTMIKSYSINSTVPSAALNRLRVKTNPSKMIVTLDENNNVVWDSTQFVFTGITGNQAITTNLEYISYNTEKSLNIVCLASSDEFFKSTNDTAKELMDAGLSDDFSNFKSEDQNLHPVIITQLGIHDAEGNLLAICKPTQPVKKYWYDVVSFNVKIRL